MSLFDRLFGLSEGESDSPEEFVKQLRKEGTPASLTKFLLKVKHGDNPRTKALAQAEIDAEKDAEDRTGSGPGRGSYGGNPSQGASGSMIPA